MLLPLCICTESCGQKGSRNVAFFKDTPAYELAKAVGSGNLEKIESLVKADSTLLEVTEVVYGSNVLILCIDVEQFESFKKLLELGADPNFINPYTKYSVLIDAIKLFGNSYDFYLDNRYAKLLLEYGAGPDYAVEYDFTNEKTRYVVAASPLMRASALDLDLVKTLIQYGADPFRKLGERERSLFAAALLAPNFDIIYYLIDSLKMDVHQPMSIRSKDSIFIQDFVVNKKMFQIIRAEEGSVKDTVGFVERWELKRYLESKGVDFVNYKYKRLK